MKAMAMKLAVGEVSILNNSTANPCGILLKIDLTYRGANYFRGFFFGRPKLGGGIFGTAP